MQRSQRLREPLPPKNPASNGNRYKTVTHVKLPIKIGLSSKNDMLFYGIYQQPATQ